MTTASLLLAAALALPARAAEPATGPLSVSPERVRTSPTRAVAEELVARLRRACDEAGAPGRGVPPARGARLVMLVPASAFPVIARFGFLNEHQTRTTGGFFRPEERFEAEQELAMSRLPYDLHGRELLPKYAFLDAPDRGLGRSLLPTRGGTVAVVFKEEVAARATWTYAGTLDRPRRVGRYSAGGAANPVLPRTFAYRRKPGDRLRCAGGCEAQIWGELRLDDVDYVMIPEGAPVPAGAGEAGVAVYRYSVPASTAAAGAPARTLVYRRGARVKTAPAEKLPSDEAYRDMPALKALRQAFEEQRLPDRTLAAEFDKAPGIDQRRRLVGVMASRPKTPPLTAALEKASASQDPPLRALALYGLSDLPWERFEPYLLAAFKDPDWRVQTAAAALSADRRDEPAVARARAELARASTERLSDPSDDRSAGVLEWLSRADRPALCAPEAAR